MYIVQRQQAQSENLVAHEEMPNVGTAEPRTGGTVAALVQWQGVIPVLGPLDVEPPLTGEYRAIPAHPRWRNAVEEIHPAPDAFDEILGKPDAHQISRPVPGERVVHDVEHVVHRRFF